MPAYRVLPLSGGEKSALEIGHSAVPEASGLLKLSAGFSIVIFVTSWRVRKSFDLFVGVLLLLWIVSAAGGQQTVTGVTMAGSEQREDDLPSLASAPDGSLWLAWLSYSDRRDEIALRRYSDGVWGNLQYVPNTSGDSWFPQVAVEAGGRVWVVWSQREDGNWDLYARGFDGGEQAWGPLLRLTGDPGPDINHRVAGDRHGRISVVWQGFRSGRSNIYLKTLEGGEWSGAVAVTGNAGRNAANDWDPAVAIDSSGTSWVAYDSYRNGNYDVYLREVKNGKTVGAEVAIAETPLFEARATVAADREDRVWVAWESGGANWGKDTGYKIRGREPGVRLGAERTVRIRCYSNGRLQAPREPLQQVFSAGAGKPKWTYQPHVFSDGPGNVWVAAKRFILDEAEGEAGELGYFEYWLTRYDGDRWIPATPLPNSWGRSSTRISAATTGEGDPWLAWPTDKRRAVWVQRPMRGEVYAAKLTPPSRKAPLLAELPVERVAPKPSEQTPGHAGEARDVAALRGYRTSVGGKQVQLLRGDLHRHTELSWDDGGGNDGSLPDFYRYMLDAAALDFGASTDHQGGAFDYWWWYTQKLADMYHVPGAFTPLYGYERSLSQPNGHRNVLFANRSGWVVPFFYKQGVKIFELGQQPQGDVSGIAAVQVVRDDTKHLYEEVRRMGGITIPHTSATEQGTDWRDNDPEIEPVVEIFQGARTSYESAGAPLTAQEGGDDAHIRISGYYPEGFVQKGWGKGYRLGVIASSDHHSTHYSYAMVYTENLSREGILDAIRRRHTYGATDNILLDVRMGPHFMGDEFRAAGPLPLRVKVRGTRDIARVRVIRGDQVIYTYEPDTREVAFEYTDTDERARSGRQYYYVRVEQIDNQIAWSSPIWVNY